MQLDRFHCLVSKVSLKKSELDGQSRGVFRKTRNHLKGPKKKKKMNCNIIHIAALGMCNMIDLDIQREKKRLAV